jgi:outer membrane lipoprotein-sorting protein
MTFFKFFSVLIFSSLFLLGGVNQAQAKAPASEMTELSSAFKSLRSAGLVTMKVNKKVTSPWMVKPKEASGVLYFSKDKIRLQIEEPDPMLVVLSGADIWQEEKQPKEFGGGVQVSHISAKRAKKSSALLALLFGETEIWKELKLVSKKAGENQAVYLLQPKDSQRLEVKELKIVLAGKGGKLKSVAFSDELDNLTEFEFEDVKTSSKSKPELFKYRPPKGAEVTSF